MFLAMAVESCAAQAVLPEPQPFGPPADASLPELPPVLRPLDAPDQQLPAPKDDLPAEPALEFFPLDAPLGFAGPSGILPREGAMSTDGMVSTEERFQPVEDRWRMGFPDYDRYGKGHPSQDDYPGIEGRWWDPYNQNVLKGDYPIIGRDIFFRVTGRNQTLFEGRQLPTPTTPFEATRDPGTAEFFGDPDQYAFNQNNSLSLEFFKGSSTFRPVDWRIKSTLIYNLNHLVADELAVVTPDVRDGQSRFRQYLTMEEWFLEAKLLDTSPTYDFASGRIGSQFFTSDFRGFVFSDTNRGVRLFGTRLANRDQYNVVWFDQTEKDTNSTLNRLTKTGTNIRGSPITTVRIFCFPDTQPTRLSMRTKTSQALSSIETASWYVRILRAFLHRTMYRVTTLASPATATWNELTFPMRCIMYLVATR